MKHKVAGRRQRGLTLVELMMGLALAAVVLALAVPAARTLLANVQRGSLVTEVSIALIYGRSEAVKDGLPVSLCPGSAQAGCAAGERPDWAPGWVVFKDPNGDRSLDDGDRLLRVHQFEHPLFTLYGSDGLRKGVTFRPSGFAAAGGWLDLCPLDPGDGYRIELTAAGQLRVHEDVPCVPGPRVTAVPPQTPALRAPGA